MVISETRAGARRVLGTRTELTEGNINLGDVWAMPIPGTVKVKPGKVVKIPANNYATELYGMRKVKLPYSTAMLLAMSFKGYYD